MGESFGELRPYAAGFRAEVEIDFTNPVIGRQSYVLDLEPGNGSAARSAAPALSDA